MFELHDRAICYAAVAIAILVISPALDSVSNADTSVPV